MTIVTSWMEEGLQQGLQQEQAGLVLRLLTRRFSELPLTIPQQIGQLSTDQLGMLAEVLLDFSTLDDLNAWLQQHAQPEE